MSAATEVMSVPSKGDDPRYIPGLAEWDDRATDEEWFAAMGPAPAPEAPEEDSGPVCEACGVYLPARQIASRSPLILCEDCHEEGA